MHFPCHLAPWGMQSDDLNIFNHWNLLFALEPIISQWEWTHDLEAARAARDRAMSWRTGGGRSSRKHGGGNTFFAMYLV